MTHLSLTSFLREATLAYTKQVFLVSNHAHVTSVEQKLMHTQTDIHLLAKHVKSFNAEELAQAYTAPEDLLYHLEQFISEQF